MGLFGLRSKKDKIGAKAVEGITAYQNRDFKKASIAFEEYFKMKGTGRFPDLDEDDPLMLMNLGNSKQYSLDYHGAIRIYDKALEKVPSWDGAFLMKAVCHYKLGEKSEAKKNWVLARDFGNDIAQNPFETEILNF